MVSYELPVVGADYAHRLYSNFDLQWEMINS